MNRSLFALCALVAAALIGGVGVVMCNVLPVLPDMQPIRLSGWSAIKIFFLGFLLFIVFIKMMFGRSSKGDI